MRSELFTVCFLAVLSAGVWAQAGLAKPQSEESGLAKPTQNPVGDIVSVPFQFNFNNGGAYQDQTFFNLNFQRSFRFT